MCLAVPGKIISIVENIAKVEIMGVTRDVSIDLLKNANVGDNVLVHAGCAIQKVDEDEAAKTLELFNELKELMKDGK